MIGIIYKSIFCFDIKLLLKAFTKNCLISFLFSFLLLLVIIKLFEISSFTFVKNPLKFVWSFLINDIVSFNHSNKL